MIYRAEVLTWDMGNDKKEASVKVEFCFAWSVRNKYIACVHLWTIVFDSGPLFLSSVTFQLMMAALKISP